MKTFERGRVGNWYDYTGDVCPNCERVRVLMTESGKRICEKCKWIIEDEMYGDEWEDYEEDSWDLFPWGEKVINTEARVVCVEFEES